MKRLFHTRGVYKDKIYVSLLVLFAFITHRAWFYPSSVLSFGDWQYWPVTALRELSYAWGTWVSFLGFGAPNIQMPFQLFTTPWSWMAHAGVSYDIATKITFMIPIALLGFLAPYVFSKRIIGDSSLAFAIALFYGTTTYFLSRQESHLPIAFVYAAAPLVAYMFFVALEKNKPRHWLGFVIIFALVMCYEIRIAFIVLLALVSYYIVNHISQTRKYLTNAVLATAVLIGLNLFWLLPTMLGGLSGVILAVANRGLFGSFLFDLLHAITISDASWTGSYPDIYFIKQPVMLISWIVPVLALLSPLVVKKSRRLLSVWFLLIAIIGILLTKQSSPPWPGLYLWLYEHAPGFNLFREASKFYLLTALGYTGLLALGMEGATTRLRGRGKQIFTIFAVVLFLALAAYNTKPLITGEIGTMFKPRTISNDYIVFEKFLNGQEGFFRTLWVPYYSRYGAFSIEHPKVSLVTTNQTFWQNFIGKDAAADQSKPQNIVALLKSKDAQTILADSSIKYVIIPIKDIQNDDNFFRSYGNSRQYFINEVRKLKYLKPVDIGAKDLLVYENKQYFPHIQGKNLTFKQINPTKYIVSMKSIKDKTDLRFNEAFHKGWMLYSSNGLDLKGKKVANRGDSSTEIISGYKFMGREDIGYLWSKPVLGETHKKTQDGLNQWIIDAKIIKRTWPKDAYHLNRDGSIDVNLVVYFKPQSYFYLGLIISLSTLVSCIALLIYLAIRRFTGKRQKKPLVQVGN